MYKSSKKVEEYGGWINGCRAIDDMFPGNNGTSGGLIGCKKTLAEAKKSVGKFSKMLQFIKGSGDCIGFSSVCSVKGVALRGRSRAGQSSGVEIERSVITVEVEMLGVSDATALCAVFLFEDGSKERMPAGVGASKSRDGWTICAATGSLK